MITGGMTDPVQASNKATQYKPMSLESLIGINVCKPCFMIVNTYGAFEVPGRAQLGKQQKKHSEAVWVKLGEKSGELNRLPRNQRNQRKRKCEQNGLL